MILGSPCYHKHFRLMTNPAQLAKSLYQAQRAATHHAPITKCHPGFTLARATRVAQQLHTLRLQDGAKFVGRKIGFTNPRMWTQYDIEAPIWGPMYAHTVSEIQEDQGTASLRSLVEPKIEPEIVFGMKAPLLPQYNITAILDRIAWVAIGYELVQSHFPNWTFQAPDAVAAGSLHGHLFIGKKHHIHELGSEPIVSLKNFKLGLYCNSTLAVTGTGADVLGNPLKAVQHLVQVLAEQQVEPLGANEIITTGTVTLAQPVTAGQTWSITLDGLPLSTFALTLKD